MNQKPAHTILIVDDDAFNVQLLERFLSDAYIVRTAYNGEDALDIIRSDHIDLVLLDVMMPGMDGFDVCRSIKSSRSTQLIQVIIITALSSPDDRIMGLEAGADEFLVKPINRIEVVTRVNTLIKNKQLYDELIAERDRAQNYLDIAGSMIVAFDDKGTVKLANRECCRVLGYVESEFVGKNWLKMIVPPEDRGSALSVFSNVMEGKIEHAKILEYAVLTKSGEKRIVRWEVSYLKNPDGSISGILSSGSDVTEERLSSIKLKASEEKYRLLAENANDVIWTLGKNGIFTYTSPSVIKLRGYTPEEVAKQTFDEIFPSEHKETIVNAINRFYNNLELGQGHYSETFEIEQYHKDGHRVWTETVANPVFDDEGNFQFFLGVSRDITERKKAEEKISTYAEEMAHLNEELKSLERMKDEFISNLSHELKTPLISIKGYSELVYDEVLGPLNSKQKTAMKTVLEKYENLSFLMDSLIYMSIVKSGKVDYRLDPIRVMDSLTKVIDYFEFRSQEKELLLLVDIEDNLPLIRGDVEYIPYLFRAIIDNAIKFSPDGSTVLIRAFNDNGNVHIIVKDSGIGIPSHELDNIFRRFYQIDGSMSRKYGGSGLGLYVSKTIAEIHGGRIWIESEEGQGTTVHVLLPPCSQSALKDMDKSLFLNK